ncbi:MAG: dihydrofolate reductase [Desulfocapsaceae bacterium]|jgi:dihydrofolate reductase|nr:dihydrofolate reductase [Desulfocapsaceae bacterium]
MPEFIIIVAIAQNGVIGRDGRLPWHLPSDLKHFKKTTMNCPIIMGRKTFDSIGRPLPGRKNIVLSRNTSLELPGCFVVHSIEEVLDICEDDDKVFIIGGADIFNDFLSITDTIIVTALEREVAGDIYFPEINPAVFKQTEAIHHNLEEPYAIIRYERAIHDLEVDL